MRHGRSIYTAGLAALMTTAIAAAPAAAATLTDDTATDFAAGALDRTVVDPAGAVTLARVMKTEEFQGATLPVGWTMTPWPSAGTASVAAGSVTVDGARVVAPREYGPGQVLEFTALFSGQQSQHVGFGKDFSSAPWAMISTKNGGATLYARTWAGPAATPQEDPIGVLAGTAHKFRIEWTATDVKYFVDDGAAPVVTHGVVSTPMNVLLSDYLNGGGNVRVDALGLRLYELSGTFASRVHAASARATWGTLAPALQGTAASFATRTGDTAIPDASWSGFQPVGAGGKIASPPGRYIQYLATLSTADDRTTPRLDRVDLSYEPIVGPPATGGGNTPPAAKPDRKAPRVSIAPRSPRATAGGAFKLRVKCPASERRCKVKVALFRGDAKAAPTARVRLAGGERGTLRLRLYGPDLLRLNERGKLRLTARVRAIDAAGNARVFHARLTIRSAA